MKVKAHGTLLAVILTAALAAGAWPSPALAGDDGAGPPAVAELAAGHTPVWLVTYMKSRTGEAIQSATVISVTNQGSGTCATSVDFQFGGGGVACTTTLTLGPGQTLEHCSRSLPDSIVTCNSTCSPALTFTEGNAIVGMPSSCKSKVAVYPRVYYTSSSDASLLGVADVNLVKIKKANEGD